MIRLLQSFGRYLWYISCDQRICQFIQQRRHRRFGGQEAERGEQSATTGQSICCANSLSALAAARRCAGSLRPRECPQPPGILKAGAAHQADRNPAATGRRRRWCPRCLSIERPARPVTPSLETPRTFSLRVKTASFGVAAQLRKRGVEIARSGNSECNSASLWRKPCRPCHCHQIEKFASITIHAKRIRQRQRDLGPASWRDGSTLPKACFALFGSQR